MKTAESGGPRGLDAGKKVMGRKRHIVMDIGGRCSAPRCRAPCGIGRMAYSEGQEKTVRLDQEM